VVEDRDLAVFAFVIGNRGTRIAGVGQSSPSSPGSGTIPAISTINSTGRREATSGAVKAPNDWATRISPVRSPIASTTVSAYSVSPADSSSQGRSAATTSVPRSSNSGATRCQ
jgi:hypothetical protein